MSEAFSPELPGNGRSIGGVERQALLLQARTLQQLARATRDESRELVARCVEGRIAREDGRSRRATRARP